ncbi:MAG: hypothetical protein COA79_14175 [Planctomycetota bacterium]|nr:MAG: hypothetical protein COA79_14175 [Planctomycetota bacterium]
MLLKRGVSYGTFSDLAKWVFVDIAKKDFAIPGKKNSNSRISVITGLTRHDVKATLEMEKPDEEASKEKYNRAVNIVTGWTKDPDYLSDNEPRSLTYEGDKHSFTDLVKKYGGDITVRSIFDELQRTGMIEQLVGDKIKLRKEFYLPNQDLDQKYSILGSDVSHLISTINHNIENQGPRDFLQLKASYISLPEERAKIIQNDIKRKGIKFIDEIHTWLQDEEDSTKDKKNVKVYTGGLGIYYFEESEEK